MGWDFPHELLWGSQSWSHVRLEPFAELHAAVVGSDGEHTSTLLRPFTGGHRFNCRSLSSSDVCLGKDFHSTNQGSLPLVTKPWGPGLC